MQAELDSDIYNPEYNARIEYRDPVFPPSCTLMLKVYTVDKVSKNLCCVGYGFLPIFIEVGTTIQPPVSKSEVKVGLDFHLSFWVVLFRRIDHSRKYHNIPQCSLFVTPKFCISIVFSFSWELKWPQEKLKTMLMQNFGVTDKEHYGMLWHFWSGQLQICSILCFFLVDFGDVLCSPANELQQDSNASSREEYIPRILTLCYRFIAITFDLCGLFCHS